MTITDNQYLSPYALLFEWPNKHYISKCRRMVLSYLAVQLNRSNNWHHNEWQRMISPVLSLLEYQRDGTYKASLCLLQLTKSFWITPKGVDHLSFYLQSQRVTCSSERRPCHNICQIQNAGQVPKDPCDISLVQWWVTGWQVKERFLLVWW